MAVVNLPALLNERKWTREKLAAVAGISASTVTAACRQEKIRGDKAEAIAAALEQPVEKLFALERDTTPLSAKSLLAHHRLIHTILHEAEREMLVVYNAADKATPPKLHTWGNHNDQGNAAVNILQLFNGAPVAIEIEKDTEHIDSSRFTIILGGAFNGLEDIVRKRTQPTKIGFGRDVSKPMSAAEAMLDVTVDDLQKYGFSPEILGRIGAILSIPELGLEDHRQLLTAKSGSLHQRYRNYLWNLYGCEFEITDAAVEAIAQRCMESNTGARAANPIVNGLMWPAVAAVEGDATICKVILDTDASGCIVRYEHGPRGYSFRDSARQQTQEKELPWHTIRASSPAVLTRKLLRYYRNAGGPILRCCRWNVTWIVQSPIYTSSADPPSVPSNLLRSWPE